MACSSQLRLMSDLKSIINEPPEGCSASPLSDENLFSWSATIFGPDETPWEGGIFGLRLTFGDCYPENSPRVRFTCEIFHHNDGSRTEQTFVYFYIAKGTDGNLNTFFCTYQSRSSKANDVYKQIYGFCTKRRKTFSQVIDYLRGGSFNRLSFYSMRKDMYNISILSNKSDIWGIKSFPIQQCNWGECHWQKGHHCFNFQFRFFYVQRKV